MKLNNIIRKIKFSIRGTSSSLLFKLMHPKGFDVSDALVICGTTRSGSTWLAEIVSSIEGHAQIFEPLQARYIKDARVAGVKNNLNLRANEEWLEGRLFFERIISGKLINSWLASQLSLSEVFKAKRLVVKMVRANMMIGWLTSQFPIKPPALVIRHPCAVVASQLHKGWTPSLKGLLGNRFFKEHSELKEQCKHIATEEGTYALAWCMRYYVPLTLDKPHPFVLICYENLVRNGKDELTRLFNAWDIELTEKVISQLHIPSDTVAENSQVLGGKDPLAGWKTRLTELQVNNVLAVLKIFSMDFYDHELEPQYDKLSAFMKTGINQQ